MSEVKRIEAKEKLIKIFEETFLHIKNDLGKILVLYDGFYMDSFEEIKTKYSNEKIIFSTIINSPERKANMKESIIYNRIIHNQITKEDIFVYFGNEENKLLLDLILNYSKTNRIFHISPELNAKEVTIENANLMLRKRYNLILKAKEAEVFGIIVGSLSISNINDILNQTKNLIQSKLKKCYIFLLGKITMEKLSNFVEFIDCFILLACPECSNHDLKALMKPIINPIDLFFALDETFIWDLQYSFDNNNLFKKIESNHSKKLIKDEKEELKMNNDITDVSEIKNKELANVFNLKMINYFDDRKFKGLDISTSSEVKKFELGRTGIPIKYENLK